MLPGHHQPLLQVLSRTEPLLSLELEGYGPAHREQLRIESVGETVVGPSEVRRYLDDEIADSLSIQGPIVLVQARLESHRFQVDGRWYRYQHGMHATVRVKLGRPKRILLRLMPWLERLFRENDG